MRTSTIKSIAAVALTGVGSALVLGFKTSDQLATSTGRVDAVSSAVGGSSGTSGSATRSGSTGTTETTGTTGTTGTASGSTGSSGSSSRSGTYADGTWTGDPVREPWGPFQVAVVISNGTISAVSVVESPNDRHSSRINSQAVPLLTQSVLASRGASIDMVSGATWTSESYAESLQSALDAAKAG
jgi:uncharacterized protein with FMN-binding domain